MTKQPMTKHDKASLSSIFSDILTRYRKSLRPAKSSERRRGLLPYPTCIRLYISVRLALVAGRVAVPEPSRCERKNQTTDMQARLLNILKADYPTFETS